MKIVEIVVTVLLIAFGAFVAVVLINSVKKALQKISFFVSDVAEYVTFPFTAPYEKLCSFLKNTLDKLVRAHTHRLRQWGGIGQIFSGIIILSLTVFAIADQIKAVGLTAVLNNQDLVLQLPPFFILSLAFDSGSPFSFESLVQMTLFNVIAVTLLRRVAHLSGAIRIVYEIVFLLFSIFAPLYIPDIVYTFPQEIIEGIKNTVSLSSGTPFFKLVLSGLVLLVYIYLLIILYVLALREVIASLAFSIWPFALIVVVNSIITQFGFNLDIIIWLVVITAVIIYHRDRTDEELRHEDEHEYKKRAARERRAARRREKEAKRREKEQQY